MILLPRSSLIALARSFSPSLFLSSFGARLSLSRASLHSFPVSLAPSIRHSRLVSVIVSRCSSTVFLAHTRALTHAHTCAHVRNQPLAHAPSAARAMVSAFFPHHTPRPASSHAWGPGTIAERPFLHRASSSAHRTPFTRRRSQEATPFPKKTIDTLPVYLESGALGDYKVDGRRTTISRYLDITERERDREEGATYESDGHCQPSAAASQPSRRRFRPPRVK